MQGFGFLCGVALEDFVVIAVVELVLFLGHGFGVRVAQGELGWATANPGGQWGWGGRHRVPTGLGISIGLRGPHVETRG